jgi:heme oxygenase
MTDEQQTIMRRLKWETRDLHSHTESRPLQRQIAGGTVSRERFVAYLGQLLIVHRALESALERTCSVHPSIPLLAQDDRMRVPDLTEDLESYGVDPATVQANPAARRRQRSVAKVDGAIKRGQRPPKGVIRPDTRHRHENRFRVPL